MMYRKMLKSKIHRAVVTGTDLSYEGSITIDRDLLDKAGIRKFEFVQVVNLNNGARFETYAICGEPGSGIIELNGAAARMAQPGDEVIIMSYLYAEEPLLDNWQPEIILVGAHNQIEEEPC
jgi:aspartate 1-decarboxylase